MANGSDDNGHVMIVAIVALLAIGVMAFIVINQNSQGTQSVSSANQAVVSSDNVVGNTPDNPVAADSAGNSIGAVAEQNLGMPENVYCIEGGGSDNPDEDIFVRGEVTYVDQYGKEFTVQDFCRNFDSSTLVKYKCLGNSLSRIEHECPNGCSSGACLR